MHRLLQTLNEEYVRQPKYVRFFGLSLVQGLSECLLTTYYQTDYAHE